MTLNSLGDFWHIIMAFPLGPIEGSTIEANSTTTLEHSRAVSSEVKQTAAAASAVNAAMIVPENNEKKSHGLQLNLGAKDGKDMLNLSSDSDSDGDYEEVNEIV